MLSTKTEFFLIGDSHAVALGDAAREAGRDFKGGPLGTGRDLEQPFFRVENNRFVLTSAKAKELKTSFESLLTFPGPILCSVGFNAVRFAKDMREYLQAQGCTDWREAISEQAFRSCVINSRQVAIDFYQVLAKHQRSVWFVPSPQLGPSKLLPLLHDFETVLIPEVEATGARLIDVRDKVSFSDETRQLYERSKNDAHGNTQYGELVLDHFDAMLEKSHRSTP